MWAAGSLPWVPSLGEPGIPSGPRAMGWKDRLADAPAPLPLATSPGPLGGLSALGSSGGQALTGGNLVAEPGVGGPSSRGSDRPFGSMSFPARELCSEAQGGHPAAQLAALLWRAAWVGPEASRKQL